MAKEIFDYSKTSPSDYVYYGFHLKNDRYHIDTRRIIKLGYKSIFPEALFSTPRNTHYFEPKYKNHSDYAVNILIEQLNRLVADWNDEYKIVIDNILTPKDVKDKTRLEAMMYVSSADDLDEIGVEATFAGIMREPKYNEVIKSIHLQYLQKIFTEFFRAILLVIKDRGYENKYNFTYGALIEYVQEKTNVDARSTNPLYKLPHYKWFDALNKIDNFLKHNTVKAYNALANNPSEKDKKTKIFLSKFVYSFKETGIKYENGMYAGNWLKFDCKIVDEMLNNLREFAKEFCKLIYGEYSDEASWNSDEGLVAILKDRFFDLF